ncbi:MAG TPA: zinc ribbon domain-containing protein [Pyrinomonadaceae bacterium]
MEPEISHRCPSCGASVRSSAQFCPQCGRQLKGSASDSLSAPEAADSQPLQSSTQDLRTTPLPPLSTVIEASSQGATPSAADVAAPDAADGNHAVAQRAVAAKDESLSKRQRVKEAARGVMQENVRPRVEKLRQASSTMIEEASAIDPSLRFIIIAVFLFIIFIVMLLLSFIK